MANHSTKSITIYQKTYQLPVLESNSFQQIQTQIRQRQQIIKTQERIVIRKKEVEKKSFFGFLSNKEIIEIKTRKPLSFEEKFEELDRLVNDYNQLISFLTEHKQLYLDFFAQLTNDLKIVVGQKKPNKWGLYDMAGNVWEWCEDNWQENYNNHPTDGSAVKNNDTTFVLRGGSWGNYSLLCRCAFRGRNTRASNDYYNGFRIICVCP